MKQTKACETNFKQPQNETKLNLKPTQKTRGIEPRCSTRRINTCKYKNNLTNLGNETDMTVGTFNMLQKAA
jgi:hypothetical protein